MGEMRDEDKKTPPVQESYLEREMKDRRIAVAGYDLPCESSDVQHSLKLHLLQEQREDRSM
jgi:hypothetical protein